MARGSSSRGGGKGKSGGAPIPRDVTVSKKLSWLLRHGAEKEGLKLGRGGYVNLEDVLKNRNIKSLQPPPTLSEIKAIVAENAKQRFSLIHISAAPSEPSEEDKPATAAGNDNLEAETDTDPSHYLIRANQGHSLKLESGGDDLLTPITAEAGNLPRVVVHGTRREHWGRIVESGGLKPMGRNHVHFATGVPASFKDIDNEKATADTGDDVAELSDKKNAPAVVSGMRETSSVLMFLDLRKALDAGLAFYLSENGVVLCEGNEKGLVGLELFEKVIDRKGKVLVEDGTLVGELEIGKGRQGKEAAPRVFQKHQTLPIRDKRPQDGAKDGS